MQHPKPPKRDKKAPNLKRTLKKKLPKAESIRSLVKELDRVFSIHTRMKYADEQGMAKCYTCDSVHHWKAMDCGHFFSRRHYSLRWTDENTKIQCKKCNIFQAGNQYEFGKRLLAEIGQERMDILEQRKNNKFKLERGILKLLINQYK